MQNLIGQNVDRYLIVSLLFEDQSTRAYLAQDPKFDRNVTIYFPKSLEQQTEPMLRTIRSMVNWRYAGIARLLDFGTYGERIYYVQEFLASPNLNQIQQSMRQADCWPSLKESILLCRELCIAADTLHQQGIIHGNLDPSNIFFRQEPSENLPYQPVIVRTGMIKPGSGLRSSFYQAPEFTRLAKVDKKADIFSIGAILFELATGQPPTPQPQASSGPPQVLPPHLLHPDLSETIETTILKSLSPNPDDRFEDASTFASALSQILDLAELSRTAPSGISSTCQIAGFLRDAAQGAVGSESSAPADLFETLSTRPKVDVSQDRVYVLMPDKTVRNYKMKPSGLSIGRTKDNDIALDLPGISRHHARIDFDGQNYTVIDLGSLNGSFIEQKRIPVDKPQIWLPGDNLRVGEAWLRVERQAQGRTTQAVISRDLPTSPNQPQPGTDEIYLGQDGNPLDSAQVLRSPGLGWVGAFTESLNLAVNPGASIDIPILLFNRGPANDTFQVAVQGLPHEWVSKIPMTVRISSNSQKEIRVAIRPPRSAQVRAGRYALIIVITSQNSSDQVVELRPTLTVAAFSQFSSELRPESVRAGEIGQVYIHNRGNLPETFTVVWEDKAHMLVFDPPKVKVNLQVGKSAIVEFRPSLLHTRLVGPENSHEFQTHVSSQGGQIETHRGEYLSRGIIPTWAPAALVALGALLACILCLIVNQVTSPVRKADKTAQAEWTAVAQATITSVFQRTATVQSQEGANNATAQSATATSIWLNLDEDQDGLTNELEILAGTLPNVADTDGDGLTDGQEVHVWKTNPLVADTDGDGLIDGVEVERGTNPLLRDTDGDGLDDGIDPDPLNPPTRTPFVYLPTATHRPKITPTFTSLPTPTFTLTASATPQFTDLAVEISNGQDSSIPGTATMYTILVTNKGPLASPNTKIIAQFPPILKNVSWICSASPGSACQNLNGTGNIDIFADLKVGGTATLIVNSSIIPTASGLLTSVARAIPPANLMEITPANNQATDTDTLTPHAALALSKTDSRETIFPGQPNVYTITVVNNGPSAVSNIEVMDNLPDQLKNISWTCSATPGSGCAAASVQSGNINTQINLLPSGTATFRVDAKVRDIATGTIANTVSIISPIDPAVNNKTATDTTAIIPRADLSLAVQAPVTITKSTILTYTITITNTGPSTASGIQLTSTLTNTVTFISSDPNQPVCKEDSGIVSCKLGSLTSGAAKKVQIIIRSPSSTGPFKKITEIKAEQIDPDLTNNSITTSITVID